MDKKIELGRRISSLKLELGVNLKKTLNKLIRKRDDISEEKSEVEK